MSHAIGTWDHVGRGGHVYVACVFRDVHNVILYDLPETKIKDNITDYNINLTIA